MATGPLMVRSHAGRLVCGVSLLGVFSGALLAADPPVPRLADAEAARLGRVKEVTIDPTVKARACRRYTPTGSRIVKQRCEAPAQAERERGAAREQLRRDLDEIRMREALRDQAREQARAEALRRRLGR